MHALFNCIQVLKINFHSQWRDLQFTVKRWKQIAMKFEKIKNYSVNN